MLSEVSGSSFVSRGKSCPYLPNLASTTIYRVGGVDRARYCELLKRGWRRFGRLFFRAECEGCAECKSVRIAADEFRPDRSMRRALAKCEKLRVAIVRPQLDAARLRLYERHHLERSIRRGWEFESATPIEYFDSFVDRADDYGFEFDYYYGDRLVGVALTDILPIGVSAVYCYYEPEMADFSLGSFSILRQIEFARGQGLKHLYLGYLVRENASLAYKERFKPQEILRGRPTISDEPIWE